MRIVKCDGVVLSGDFPSIYLIGLHSFKGSVMWSTVSMFSPMFIRCFGDLVVHLL